MRKKMIAVFLLGLVCGLVLMGGLMQQDQRLAAEAAPQDTVVSAAVQEETNGQTPMTNSSPAAAGVSAWDREKVYTGGKEVTYGGNIYRAKW